MDQPKNPKNPMTQEAAERIAKGNADPEAVKRVEDAAERNK